MNKRLIQYGGYLISVILIAWSINPNAAIYFLALILKTTILFGIPVTGVNLLNKIILLKQQKIWNLAISLWLIVSLIGSYWIVNYIEQVLNT